MVAEGRSNWQLMQISVRQILRQIAFLATHLY